MLRFLLLTCSLLLALPALAQINIIPTRVVFEPGQRSAEVTLINTASQAYTFRMGWQDIQYDEWGNSQRVEEGVARLTPAASDFIRFSPRLVTVPAGGSQTIRLMKRGQQGAGEYRSHFLFQRQAAAPTQMSTGDDSMSIALNVALGVTIPVIIREGAGEADVHINAAYLHQGEQGQALRVTLERRGRYSARADLNLWEGQGSERSLLAQSGARPLYTDTNQYQFELPLTRLPSRGQPLVLEVTYTLRNGNEHSISYPL